MNITACGLTLVLSAGVALASPTVTNDDNKAYSLHMDCKHVSFGQSVNPGATVELDRYEVGKNCKIEVYPSENPFGKDGDYDPKKRLSSAKLKKNSECVIKKARVVCE